MDTESVHVSQIDVEVDGDCPCVLCQRLDSPAILKCCEQYLCFKCYNKIARSGRTIACPHCRKNPLEFFDLDDDSTIQDQDPQEDQNDNTSPEVERIVHVILNSDLSVNRPSGALSPEMVNMIRASHIHSGFIPVPIRPPGVTIPAQPDKIVLGVRTTFLALYFLICYLLPDWTIIAFFTGLIISIINLKFIKRLVIYPVIYPIYIFNTYINKSLIWDYITKLDLFENRI